MHDLLKIWCSMNDNNVNNLSTQFGGRVSRENISKQTGKERQINLFSSWWFLASTRNKKIYRKGRDQENNPRVGEFPKLLKISIIFVSIPQKTAQTVLVWPVERTCFLNKNIPMFFFVKAPCWCSGWCWLTLAVVMLGHVFLATCPHLLRCLDLLSLPKTPSRKGIWMSSVTGK